MNFTPQSSYAFKSLPLALGIHGEMNLHVLCNSEWNCSDLWMLLSGTDCKPVKDFVTLQDFLHEMGEWIGMAMGQENHLAGYVGQNVVSEHGICSGLDENQITVSGTKWHHLILRNLPLSI